MYIVIATARYWIGAERYIEEIQPDYEITTDGTLVHQHGEQIYSCNLEIEDTNQIIQDILARNDKTEITVAAGRQVFWNSKHIFESEKLYKAIYCDYKKPLFCQANKIVAELPNYETALEIAISDVKDIADSVTLSNDEDGVAEWLVKNVLISM
ncbi:MAG: HAD hydrolase family protein [Lachnospiraceae bacterium]|nr:HAD hydrolase family protein [Lachnospiraceae bacterium]